MKSIGIIRYLPIGRLQKYLLKYVPSEERYKQTFYPHAGKLGEASIVPTSVIDSDGSAVGHWRVTCSFGGTCDIKKDGWVQ